MLNSFKATTLLLRIRKSILYTSPITKIFIATTVSNTTFSSPVAASVIIAHIASAISISTTVRRLFLRSIRWFRRIWRSFKMEFIAVY